MSHGYKRHMGSDGKPLVDQHTIGQWRITWNPDDAMYYVNSLSDVGNSRVFKEFRNAVYYAKTH